VFISRAFVDSVEVLVGRISKGAGIDAGVHPFIKRTIVTVNTRSRIFVTDIPFE
jgi:hypothetical protein